MEQQEMTLENAPQEMQDAPAMGFVIDDQKDQAGLEDEGTLVHVDGADGEPQFYMNNDQRRPVTIRIAGSHSNRFRRVEEKLRGRKIRGRAKLTQAQLFEDQLEKVIGCIISWEGFFTTRDSNGNRLQEPRTVELTPVTARALLKGCPWVLEQLTEAMNDHERFFTNS